MKIYYNPKLKNLARELRKKGVLFRSLVVGLFKRKADERIPIHATKAD